MKTSALVVLMVCGLASAFGQGQVVFRNRYSATTPPVDAPVYVGGVRVVGNDPLFRAALIGGPVATGIPTTWNSLANLQLMYSPIVTTMTWANFYTDANPGYEGYVNTATYLWRVVPGVSWYETALVQMVAWHGDYNTWVEAWTAAQSDSTVLIGFSNPLILPISGPVSPIPTCLWGLESFSIQSVPEPSACALVEMGGFIAFWFKKC